MPPIKRNVLKVKIPETKQGQNLRDYLRNDLKFSNRNLKRLSKDRSIFIGRKSVRLNYMIKGGETLMIQLDRQESQDMVARPMDLAIIHEDDSLILVNKPPYLVVHPTKNHFDDTLTNGLLYHFQAKGENSIVRLVSRLDMNTSGLVPIAKNQFSHGRLQREAMEKTYLAITQGSWQEPSGLLDFPIYWPDPNDFRRIVHEDGQASRTRYRVLAERAGFSLLAFQLETGRTHQIRVHSSHMGHPLVGDELYGGNLDLADRQMLHAYQIKLTHPLTQQALQFQAPLWSDMANLLDELKLWPKEDPAIDLALDPKDRQSLKVKP